MKRSQANVLTDLYLRLRVHSKICLQQKHKGQLNVPIHRMIPCTPRANVITGMARYLPWPLFVQRTKGNKASQIYPYFVLHIHQAF